MKELNLIFQFLITSVWQPPNPLSAYPDIDHVLRSLLRIIHVLILAHSHGIIECEGVVGNEQQQVGFAGFRREFYLAFCLTNFVAKNCQFRPQAIMQGPTDERLYGWFPFATVCSPDYTGFQQCMYQCAMGQLVPCSVLSSLCVGSTFFLQLLGENNGLPADDATVLVGMCVLARPPQVVDERLQAFNVSLVPTYFSVLLFHYLFLKDFLIIHLYSLYFLNHHFFDLY